MGGSERRSNPGKWYDADKRLTTTLIVGLRSRSVDTRARTLALVRLVDASGTGTKRTGTSASSKRTSTDRVTITVRLSASALSIKDARAGRTGSRAETASSDARVVARAEAVVGSKLVGAGRPGRVVTTSAASGSDTGTDVSARVRVRGTGETGASKSTTSGTGQGGIASTVRVGSSGRASREVLAEGTDTGTSAVCVAYVSEYLSCV